MLVTFNPHCAAVLKAGLLQTVRANWRVVFRFEQGDGFDVDYLDCH